MLCEFDSFYDIFKLKNCNFNHKKGKVDFLMILHLNKKNYQKRSMILRFVNNFKNEKLIDDNFFQTRKIVPLHSNRMATVNPSNNLRKGFIFPTPFL